MRLRRFLPLIFTGIIILPNLLAGQGQAPPEIKLQVIEVPDPKETGEPAKAVEINDMLALPEGYWVHGNYGDLLLSNGFANFVFGAVPEEETQPGPRHGNIVDAFSDTGAEENFHFFTPITATRRGATTQNNMMDHTEDTAAGSASVTTFGRDRFIENLTIDTNYEMGRGWPGALVTTTIINDGTEAVTVPILGDMVAWGGMGTFIPSAGWMQAEATVPQAEFVFGRLFDSLIMIAPRNGLFDVEHSLLFSIIVYGRDVELQPGESTSYQRWMLTGLSDPTKLFSFVNEQKGRDQFGYLAGRVQERVQLPDGRVHESADVPNSEVRIQVIRRPELPKTYVSKPYIYAMTDQNGHFQASLPPGEYTVSSASSSRAYQPSNLAIRVTPNQPSAVDHPVSRSAGVLYEIVDSATGNPIPGKVTFLPLRGTPEPSLGPPGSLKSHNLVYTGTGRGVAELPPGNYRAVASHGNEYHMDERRIRVEPMAMDTVRFELTRAFNPEGWISADLGVLTSESPQSRISAQDRVITAVAEGLDWIVTADPGAKPTDLQPQVDRFNFSDRLKVSRGFRLVSTQERQVGDFTLFPVGLCGTGTEPDFTSAMEATTPAEAMERLRALCPDSILMANRAIYPMWGVLGVQGYDFTQSKFADPEAQIDLDVDAMQVWEGKGQGLVSQSYQLYLEMLAQGHRMVPVANSMSSGTFNREIGYPRVYIPSSQSDPRQFDEAELVKNIREGRVMITNGPFIDLKVNGQPMGSTITATGGRVQVDLKVFTPNWANVANITVNMNGNFVRKFILPAGASDPMAGKVYPTSEEDSRFTLTVSEDSILTVIVEGDEGLPQDPVNPFFVPTVQPGVVQGQRTLAFSAPVFIDADGDGAIDLKFTDEAEVAPEEEFVPPF